MDIQTQLDAKRLEDFNIRTAQAEYHLERISKRATPDAAIKLSHAVTALENARVALTNARRALLESEMIRARQ